MRKVGRNAAVAAGALVAGFALAGCAGGAAPQLPSNAPEVNVPPPVSGGDGNAAVPPAPPDEETSASNAPGAPQDDGAGEQPAPDPGPQNCTANVLSVQFEAGDSGMGHTNGDLRFTNRGEQPCTLQGSPGVSFVAGTDGQQVGQPAERAPKSSGKLITLQPGSSVTSPLSIVNPGMFDPAECKPVQARGLRIYAPGDTESVFVDKAQDACSTPPEPQLTVDVIR